MAPKGNTRLTIWRAAEWVHCPFVGSAVTLLQKVLPSWIRRLVGGGDAKGLSSDPFDRAIVATAAVLNLTLVTADPAIRAAAACAVEYYPFKPSRRRA